jgi:hypothetical protein
MVPSIQPKHSASSTASLYGTRLTAFLRRVNQPDLFFPGVIFLEPGAPGFSRCHSQRLADVHGVISPHPTIGAQANLKR